MDDGFLTRTLPGTAGGATVIDNELRLTLYRMMQRARQMEQRAYDLFMQNLVKGTSHLALGQEAISTGFAAAMRVTSIFLFSRSLDPPLPFDTPRWRGATQGERSIFPLVLSAPRRGARQEWRASKCAKKCV